MTAREREQLAREIWIDERRFTIHIEPPEQGGKAYARCSGCGREILTEIGIEWLSHPSNCPITTATDGGTEQ